jgi:hypothetical protein
MKRLATLVAGLLFVCGVANAADYSANTQINWKNDGGGRPGDTHQIEWEVVNGYMALGDTTTFTFDIDKTWEELSSAESFDAEVGISQKLASTEMMGKTFSNEVSLKFATEELNSEDNKDTTSLVYVTSTDMAGVSTSLELVGKLADDDEGVARDKYEANVYLGKGFGPVSTSVEVLNAYNPDASGDGETNTELNAYANYNYDLGMGFKFNAEAGFEAGEFELGGGEGEATVYVAPQVKYSYAVNEETTFYTGVVYEALKGKTDKLFDDSFSKVDGDGKVYLGFNYTR